MSDTTLMDLQEQASLWLRIDARILERNIAAKNFDRAEASYDALHYSFAAYNHLGLITDPGSMERQLEEFWVRIYALKGV